MAHYSDDDLVRLYVDSNQNAYLEQLYERYCEKIYSKCLWFTKDSVLAQDLTHDIFLKLIAKLSTFNGKSRFSTWLYSITYNYCSDQLRLRKHRQEVYLDNGWEQLIENAEDGVAELAEQEASQLYRSFGQLPTDEQSLLMMKYQEGKSIRDIAILNGISENAVKMRLLRARSKLRQLYLA